LRLVLPIHVPDEEREIPWKPSLISPGAGSEAVDQIIVSQTRYTDIRTSGVFWEEN